MVLEIPRLELWRMIQAIAYSFPKEDPKARQAFLCLLQAVGHLLPDGESFTKAYRDTLRPPSKPQLQTNTATLWYAINFEQRVSDALGERRPEPEFQSLVQQFHEMKIDWWGPPTWTSIHYFASVYPTSCHRKKAVAFKALIVCLTYLLPCQRCRRHLCANLTHHPIHNYLSSRYRLFVWTYLLHEHVNEQTDSEGKKHRPTLEEALQLYQVEMN